MKNVCFSAITAESSINHCVSEMVSDRGTVQFQWSTIQQSYDLGWPQKVILAILMLLTAKIYKYTTYVMFLTPTSSNVHPIPYSVWLHSNMLRWYNSWFSNKCWYLKHGAT